MAEIAFGADKQVVAPVVAKSVQLSKWNASKTEDFVAAHCDMLDAKGDRVGGRLCLVPKKDVQAQIDAGKSFEDAILAAVSKHCGWA